MPPDAQQKIAASFSSNFQKFDIDIAIPAEQFKIFDEGEFAGSMEEKWNMFVIDDFLYWSRSWTDHCIFKINLERRPGFVKLTEGFVTRDQKQYRSNDIEQDKIMFLNLLQVYLGRTDLYVDPEFELDLIRQTIMEYDPEGICIKSIGHNTAGITRHLHNGLTIPEQQKYIEVFGWDELQANMKGMADMEPLTTLYLQKPGPGLGVTYYFDKEVTRLLGIIKMIVKKDGINSLLKR